MTDRTPEIIPDLGTPFSEHDAYGYNFGEELTDTPTEGTITAKFTWVHDVANDTPPSDVYVLQYAEAGWDIYDANARAGREEARPSVQEAVFVPHRDKHKVRVRLVQDLDEPGTADNGLGDAQNVVSPPGDGTHGKSSGYKLVLCHPATDGTLTTPALTMSADVTAPENMISYSDFEYSAQIFDLKITRNGDDVTYPNNPEVPVMVGEKNSMNVSMSTLPTDAGTPTYQWTIPGDVVKDFTETVGAPDATPATQYTGVKTDLPTADLQIQSPHFYWYNGSFTGAAEEVSVIVTIDGKPITIKGKFKVYRPKFNSFTGTYTTNNPASQYAGNTIQLGNSTSPGVTWNANVETPNVANAAGNIAFQQLAAFNFTAQGINNGVSYNQERKASDTMDSTDDDPRYSDSTTGIGAGSAVDIDSNDNPNMKPSITDNTVQASGTFKTYLVYKPDGVGNIWVVLGVINWSFGFNATYDNNAVPFPTWVVTTTSPTSTTTNPVGTDTYDLPEWSKRGQDVKWAEVTP